MCAPLGILNLELESTRWNFLKTVTALPKPNYFHVVDGSRIILQELSREENYAFVSVILHTTHTLMVLSTSY